VTISVVTTINLDDLSTSSAISGVMTSEVMTSEAASTYFPTITTTELVAATSSGEMAASPSSAMGHRHRHGHPGGR
jgi:hypothetical protein